MPTSPKPKNPSGPKGWRVDPIPSCPAYQDGAGHTRIPVWLTKNGRHVADAEMILLPAAAELLAERLTNALCGFHSTLRALVHAHAMAKGPGVTVIAKHPHSS